MAEGKYGKYFIKDDKLIKKGHFVNSIFSGYDNLGADIIVMGGHGRMGNGQIDKIFFGSKAEKVVRLLPCPVLCIPPEGW